MQSASITAYGADGSHCGQRLPENRLVGFLWHQGENDAAEHATYEVHYAHLMGLLRSIRDEFHVPNLPFIAGDFVYHWKNDNIEICAPVVDAIRAVCKDCGHGAFVESDGLLSNMQELHRCPLGWEDPIHFSRKAIYVLGKRYFEAFTGIVNTNWMGYRCRELQFEDHDAIIVCPEVGTENGYLAVKTEYWGAFAENAEIPLLQNGYHKLGGDHHPHGLADPQAVLDFIARYCE